MKVESFSKRFDEKVKNNEDNLEKIDELRHKKQQRIDMDRESKLQGVHRAQKQFEFQIQVKKEKILEDDQRIEEIKSQVEAFKVAREQFKLHVKEEGDRFADGETDFDQLKQKYKESLFAEAEENINKVDSISARMSFRSVKNKLASRQSLHQEYLLL